MSWLHTFHKPRTSLLRMRNCEKVLIGIILGVFGMNLHALRFEDALSGIPQQAVKQLTAGGETFRLDRDSQGIMLLPKIPMAERIHMRIAELEPDVFSEALYLIPYPEDHKSIDLEIYNLTRTVSAISGVRYLSSRRKKMHPLFDDVYAISDMGNKTAIDDPVVDAIPAHDTVLMHMREVNLGSAYYQTDYIWDGVNLGLFMENLTSLRALFKVVDSQKLQIGLLFIPTERGFLIYGACGVKLSNAFMVNSLMDPFSSFYRRLYAMVIWIYNSLHGTDRIPDFGDPLGF